MTGAFFRNMGLWCVLLFIFITTCSAAKVYLLSGTCPKDNHICNCDAGILNCTGSAGDQLVIEEFNDTKISGVKITGCKEVTIHYLAFKNSTFEFVFLGNIGILVIDRLAFLNTVVKFFEITNIPDFRPKRFSFQGMGNTTSMTIRHVKVNTLPRYFALEVGDLQLINSHVGIVQAHAFMMIRNLTVTDCHFVLIESLGFFLKNSGQTFRFTTNFVVETESEAFVFGPWFRVSMVGNYFEELKPKFFVGKYLRIFRFTDNHVAVCKSFAFQSLRPTDALVFSMNKFLLAEIHSLPFLIYIPPFTAIERNSFSCDCEIAWLFTNQTGEDHHLFMNSNYCWDKTDHVLLSNLSPVFDKELGCLDLLPLPNIRPKPTTTLAPTTITDQALPTNATAFRDDNAAGKDCPYSILVLVVLSWTIHCCAS